MIGGTKKPTKRRPLGTPSHGHESDSERETSGSHQSTTHQPSGQQHKPSTSARPDERPDPTPVRRPKPRVRRPGDPSAGGIHLGGDGDDGDDGDAPGAQAGRGDYSTGLGHPSGGHDDSRDAEPRLPSASDPAPKPKPKPKPKSRETDKDNRTDDDEPAVSGDEAGGDPKFGRQPGGLNNPERLGKGTKKSRGVNPDEDDDVEKTDLGNEPERIHVKKDDASASSKVPDAFDDEGDNELTRIQRRINAIRKGGRAKGVALAEDDADLEAVDLTLFEKFAISAAERQKRMKKTLMVNDPEMQIDIANALAETLKPRWPEYAAMGFKVAFFIGDIALIVNGITDDFYLIDIPAKEIIEGAVNLYTRLRETPEEKEAAKRNGRGESAKKLEERRQKGEVALMELTGVKNLNKQQRETYDRLRVLLAMEKKESKAE